MSSYEIASITILDIIKDKIEEGNYLTIGTNVMKYGTENSLSKSLRLLRTLRSKFVNGTQQITSYKDFLLKYISKDIHRKEIINDVCDKFGKIGNISEYIADVIKYNDIEEMVIKSSVKFINGSEDKMSIVKEVIGKISDNELNTLYKMILGVYENKTIEVLENLSFELSSKDEIKYVFNLMCLLLMKHKECKDSIISKILIILLENSDISVGINALNKVVKYKKFSDNSSKRQIGDTLYVMFRKITDEIDKEKIYTCVKQIEIEYSFSRKDGKKREFTDEENSLIKKIDKSKVA